jgi:hypothetical protein
MKPLVTMRDALSNEQLLGNALAGDSWAAWRILLIAMMGEPLTDDERVIFTKLTGRTREPLQMIEEATLVAGRRGGKSRAMAAGLAVYVAALCEHPRLVPGERGIVLMIAPDQKQAKISLDYCTACFEQSPLLRQLIAVRTADELQLTNGISVQVRSSSFRRLRGLTAVLVIADEASYFFSDEFSANADVEILNAARPCLASTGGPLVIASSPYAKRGVVYENWERYYRPDADPKILVAQAATRDLNPSLEQSFIDRAYAKDPISAASEYGAEFRGDLASYITLESVLRCVEKGCVERGPLRGFQYRAFADPSGGSGSDSFAVAIAHKEGAALGAETVIIDKIMVAVPPFNPEQVTQDMCDTLLQYRCSRVVGDSWGGEWPRQAFRKGGVSYAVATKSRSELYADLLPLLNARSVDLVDHPKLIAQLCQLERRTGRAGKDSIGHPQGQYDDVANCVAGAVSVALSGASSTELWRKQPTVILGHQAVHRRYPPSTPLPRFSFDDDGRRPAVISGRDNARRVH